MPGHLSYKGEPARIAGMGKPRVTAGEGLTLEDIRWTQDGLEHAGHYPDLSPAVKLDATGEVVAIHSAALARNGAVRDLHLFSAGLGAPSAADITVMEALRISPEQWRRHNGTGFSTLSAAPEMRENLCRAFGLPATASDEKINARLEAFQWAQSQREHDSEAGQAANLKQVAERARAYADELGLPVAAIGSGSDSPASRLSAADRQTLRDLGHDTEASAAASAREAKERELVARARQIATISPEERAIMQRMGISEEMWLRHA